MTDHSIKIETTANQQRPKKRWGWLYGIAALAVVCYLASIFVLFPGIARKPQNMEVLQRPTRVAAESDEHEPLVDEADLQWISPTSGPPITLEDIPSGTQAILHLRPADLVTHREGEKILAGLGPWGQQKVAEIEQFTGAKLNKIESLVVALLRVEGRWDCTLRATFQGTRTELPSDVAGHTAFLPAAGQGRVLVSCPRAMAEEIKKQGDQPALVSRDMGRLLALTDRQRSATWLMPAKFLDTEGRELFSDTGYKLIDAFHTLIPDNASAVMVSCDWQTNFFCELAATIIQNAPPSRFNAKFAAQLAAAEKQLAATLTANPPHPYGRAVEERFPAMLHAMSDYTRVSSAQGIALARCYLPLQAGHNLLLASRLQLNGTEPFAESAPVELSLAERLGQVTTLSFPKETLENALEILAADADLPIQIAGRDLQLEGITKNQTFALDVRNRTVAEILVEVLRRANPDREAAGVSDPRQKLVYVVRDDAVIVTTRAAAAQRGEELPEVFRVERP